MTEIRGDDAPGQELTVVDESGEAPRVGQREDQRTGSRRSTFRVSIPDNPETDRPSSRLAAMGSGVQPSVVPGIDSTVVTPSNRRLTPNARRGTVSLNLEDVLDDEEADGLSALERLSGHLDLPVARPEVPSERQSSDKPAAELDHYIRIVPATDPYAGATFKDVDVVLIGRRHDQDIYVEHDLVDGNHAEITYRDGLFEIAPVAGSVVHVAGKRVDERRVLCRGDEFTLVGPGGPRFTVEMLKPDREPGRPPSRLPLLLRWLSPIVDPLAARHNLPPLVVLIVGVLALAPILIGLVMLYLLWQDGQLVPEVTPRMMIRSWSERSASAPVGSELEIGPERLDQAGGPATPPGRAETGSVGEGPAKTPSPSIEPGSVPSREPESGTGADPETGSSPETETPDAGASPEAEAPDAGSTPSTPEPDAPEPPAPQPGEPEDAKPPAPQSATPQPAAPEPAAPKSAEAKPVKTSSSGARSGDAVAGE